MWGLLLIALTSNFASAELLCSKVEISNDLSPRLSSTEKRLVCGDPETDAWKIIPPNQAQRNLKVFLQQRGYLHPITSTEGGHLRVELGKKTLITSIRAEGAPEGFDLNRKRKIVGEPLIPDRLNGLENWVTKEVQRHGYACSHVTTEANSDTGEVVVKIQLGALQNIEEVFEENIPGLEKGILRRFDAFRIGKLYDGDEVSLTENRIVSDGIVESAHFRTKCDPKEVQLSQQTVPGPPRLITAGVGVNTEGAFLLKGSWRNTRVGLYGSEVDFTVLASTIEQDFNFNYDWYRAVSRFFMRPLFATSHDNEQYYEVSAIRGQYGFASNWDFPGVGYRALIGPTLDFYHTARGVGPVDSEILSLEARLETRSHDFEYYATQPRSGYSATLVGDFSSTALASEVSAQRISFHGERLWNYRDYDPPLWIFGIRGGASVAVSSALPGSSTMPQAFLLYLGGDADIRGFGRQELPLTGVGGLTSVFTDFEVRLCSVLPLEIQPLAFFDVGAIGETSFSLDSPVYYSPGVGLRWQSPIGAFRTTFAHGFPGYIGHFQFFFSYGQEF